MRFRPGRLAGIPGLCWFSLSLSLLSNLVGFLTYRFLLTSYSADDDRGLYFLIYMVLSTIIMVCIFMVRGVWTMRTLVGIRIAMLGILVGIGSFNQAVGLLLISPLIVEICIYEVYPANVVFSLGASVFFILLTARVTVDLSIPMGLLHVADYLLLLPLLSIAFSLAMKYRKWLVDYQERIDRLSNTISALTAANLGFQECANRAEQISAIEERKRITREIHDAVGYMMTNNIMMLEAASDMVKRDPERVSSLRAPLETPKALPG